MANFGALNFFEPFFLPSSFRALIAKFALSPYLSLLPSAFSFSPFRCREGRRSDEGGRKISSGEMLDFSSNIFFVSEILGGRGNSCFFLLQTSFSLYATLNSPCVGLWDMAASNESWREIVS